MKNFELTNLQGILLDIDGTLTNSEHVITPKTSESLARLKDESISYGVATGRHYAVIGNYILPHFRGDGLHITAGGGQIVKTDGEIVWEHLLDTAMAIDIVTGVLERGGGIVFGSAAALYCSDSVYESRKTNNYWNVNVARLELKDLDKLKIPLISVVQLNPAVIAFVNSIRGITPTLIRANPQRPYFDITAENVNKATAALIWAEKQNLHLKNTIAIGDSENDLDLLDSVGLGVVMGQAPENIRQHAGKVIGSANDDGLAVYLNKLMDSLHGHALG